ncbi:endo alpha-1,4 polygalactosaminidase [Methylobacterium soli]|uniref:Endo alpha-1,4 polygalactosaminidase n=1 Tax=Methylobacterium soli TaxID=553447 RepID=A0A6L3T505_9HYPH|nr:endo alpha-1,4 polygalactosaminidase [Methylobacterium soli]KAB1080273.1 endo alpha-1,4 polygalactosaminidase [Methylobacterium soli]GJE42605.1 hypothetical protein AEGHOMDF_1777 [Methylobacterium soli]
MPSRRNALRLFGLAGAATLAAIGWRSRAQGLGGASSWCVFYGEDVDPAVLKGFDIVVLDPGFKGSIEAVTAQGSKAVGYLSLGEIKRDGPFFAALDDPSAILSENPHWPGTYLVDVRSPGWHRLILDVAVPRLLAQGFTGLFFDTLDTPPHLEQLDPERNRGMRGAAIALVQAIRRRHPATTLVMNRGYALLPDLADDIDALVAESLLTTFDPQTRAYRWVDPRTVELQMLALRPLRARAHPLSILSLDYWDPADSATIRTIYDRERRLGHVPYVSTILLDQLVPEPQS